MSETTNEAAIYTAMKHLKSEEKVSILEAKVSELQKENDLLRKSLRLPSKVRMSISTALDRDIEELVVKRYAIVNELESLKKIYPGFRCRKKSAAIAALTTKIKTLKNNYKYLKGYSL